MTDRPEDPDGPPHTPDDVVETMGSDALAAAKAALSVADSLVGQQIGSFALKSVLGSGGMGTVYEAVQEQPHRRVAVKVMRQGITSKSALRRFEFESQLLGRLQHPGIAQVYEAGTHDDGSGGVPYFAMEYIANAKTLTEYATYKGLSTKERLALFARVCEAVQHGHLKGVVHRDLKPANILVDTNGQPKIIDFGVARSTNSDLAITSLHSDMGQLVGTLQYMSPEQAEADSSDIDARSDVYALGVVLYELLTGKPPYDVRQAAIHEAVQIVREAEPPKLSTIDRHLRGDIETIALKALEKERSRRYQSVSELGHDVTRYLSDEPISARPPSAVDYLRRFVRKHTAAAVAIAVVFVVLVGAVIGISVYAVEAERQRVVAEQAQTRAEAVKEFVTTMLSSVDPAKAGAMDKELMTLVLSQAAESAGEQFEEQPLVEVEIRSVIGNTYMSLGKYNDAEPHLVESLAIQRRLLGDEHPSTLHSIGFMGDLLSRQGKDDEAIPYYVEALEAQRRVLGDKHPDTLASIGFMGDLLSRLGKYDEAELYYREAMEGYRRVLGDEAMMPYYVEDLETQRRVLGDEHPDTLWSINNMGDMLYDQGKYDEAMVYTTEALGTRRRVLGDEHPDTLFSINNMGDLLSKQGKYDEALVYLTEALETRRRVLSDEHPDTLWSIGSLGDLLSAQGKYDEAGVYLLQALEGLRRILGDEHHYTLETINALVELYDAWDKPEEAKKYRDMLPAQEEASP